MSGNPTRSFYNRISRVYDLISDAGEHQARERGLELLAVGEGECVLEIGCGTGHSLVALARSAGESGQVVGVDISEGMIEVASRKLEEEGLSEHATLTRQQVPPLGFADQSFDAVFLSFTLELFPLERIPEVLKEVSRVLRPGGRIGLVAMASVLEGERESVLEKGYKWMHRHFPHIVDCQPIDAEAFLAEAGFEISVSERISLFSMPVAVLVAKLP